MGLSSSMNYLGRVIATIITGILANINWKFSFLVYLMGLIAFLLCACYLPANKLPVLEGRISSKRNISHYGNFILTMLLVMQIFFIYPSNLSILAMQDHTISTWTVAPIMALLDVIAFLMGLWFSNIFIRYGKFTFLFPPLFYASGYAVLLISSGYSAVLLGSILIGVGSGLGIPLIYATAAAGKVTATTVIPMLSATLYIGQFFHTSSRYLGWKTLSEE